MASMKNKRLLTLLFIVVLLLCIPLIAMQFTDTVDWQLHDFLIVGILLFGTSIVLNYLIGKVKGRNNQIISASILILLLVFVLLELSVGIFGTPIAGN